MGNPLLVQPGHKVKLERYDPAATRGVPNRDKAQADTDRYTLRIGERQDALYANGQRSLLVVLQGLDGSGKDGTVRRVFDHVNPTGVTVTSFKAPTALEQRHDFLWRCHYAAPPRGIIGVFNRSYYEEVLVVRVHADRLLPARLRGRKGVWKDRFALINDLEHLLDLNGTTVLKFFLHLSREEQRQRFIARQKDPTKHWKLSGQDFVERQFWDDYQGAYEQALEHTSTAQAPWYVIPADHKWVRNYWISRIVCQTLEGMDLPAPAVEDPTLLTRRFR